MFYDTIAGRTVLHAMPLLLGVLCTLCIAYRYYSKFLAYKVVGLDDSRTTPAHQFEDGQNYHSTNRWVLFGHHFAAISGAGPLIGPVLAIQYGYMPGLLWLVIGVCLAGAVQDMLVLAASVRREGKSLAYIAKTELGTFASGVVSLAIMFIVVIALAGLGFIVVKALGGEEVHLPAGMQIKLPNEGQVVVGGGEPLIVKFPPGCLIRYPNSPADTERPESFQVIWPKGPGPNTVAGQLTVPAGVIQQIPGSSWGTFTIACTIPIALFVGLYMYKIRKGAVVEASLIGAVLTLAATVAGAWIPGSPLEPWFSLSKGQTTLALTAYGFVASVLPVWMLLCPRDYLSSFLKIGTIILLIGGVFLANPVLPCPMLNETFRDSGPTFPGGLFPFVFICIMCGAISGFHALVSSGTTPKMIDNERDIRPIGYGAMLIEGLVGVVALIAAASLDPKLYYEINVDARQTAKWQPALDKMYQELGGVDALEHLPVERRDLGKVEQLVGNEALRGRTGGAVTLAVGMSFVLTDALRFALDPETTQKFVKYWYHFAIMFEALFILTTIDTGTRIARFLLQEAMGVIHPKLAETSWWPSAVLATLIVTAGWGVLVYTGSIDTIWPMFGIANQLLAVMALAIITTFLVNTGRGRYVWVTIPPMLFVVTTTMSAGYLLMTVNFPALIASGQTFKGILCMTMTVLVMATVGVVVLQAVAKWSVASRHLSIKPRLEK